jgi:DNA-directed RNA polymerase subunit E'/Rpb7
MSKACQYATLDDKIRAGMTQVSLKNAQLALQKIVTWMKKSGKGRRKWNKAYEVAGLTPCKLKT